MNMNTPSGGLTDLAQAWSAFQNHVSLRPVRDNADYERMVQLADLLADTVGDDESHPLYSLFELAMQLIERWENEHIEIPEAEPREVLRFLLETNDLKQKDLADIASQTLISDILAGRRAISKRLAQALAERFHVNIGAFV
jgi:HTH-type transcriptional regulator / antitoxin HigA